MSIFFLGIEEPKEYEQMSAFGELTSFADAHNTYYMHILSVWMWPHEKSINTHSHIVSDCRDMYIHKCVYI